MRLARLFAAGLFTGQGALAILPAVLFAAGMNAAMPAVVAPALSAVGFTPAGIAAGSIAAGVHSTIGNVAAGSLFATLQSAGMGGYGVGVVNTVAQTVRGVGYAVAADKIYHRNGKKDV
ncbi:hypothetical protein KJ359_005323 [Pestalotiopsis sp. 9143b]|nr:hypothetical protein KJ359_005323 [Pestalotiopsis sp. 9143b]